MLARQRLWSDGSASTMDLRIHSLHNLALMITAAVRARSHRLSASQDLARRDWIEETEYPGHICVERCACTHRRW